MQVAPEVPRPTWEKEEGFWEEWLWSQELKDEWGLVKLGCVWGGGVPRRHIPGRGRPLELAPQRSWEKSSVPE